MCQFGRELSISTSKKENKELSKIPPHMGDLFFPFFFFPPTKTGLMLGSPSGWTIFLPHLWVHSFIQSPFSKRNHIFYIHLYKGNETKETRYRFDADVMVEVQTEFQNKMLNTIYISSGINELQRSRLY